MGALSEAGLVEAVPDIEVWLPAARRGTWDWPTTTEAGRAAFIWKVLQHIDSYAGQIQQILFQLSSASNADEAVRDIAERIFQPLFDYLGEQIGKGSSVLFTLERYVRQLEWFDRQRLYDAFTTNTQQGESFYDGHLREFLFREGFNMPFSQPRSPSGLSDVVSDVETEDPLVCELKLFDGANRGVPQVASGVTQALQYALDYRRHVAYLVIVNLAPRHLVLPTDGDPTIGPRWLNAADVRIYLLQARALPRESASKQGKSDPLEIARDALLGS